MENSDRNEQKQLTEKLLHNKATLEEKRRLSETEAVEKRMLKQWQQAMNTDNAKREARIWGSIQRDLNQCSNRRNYRIHQSWAAACVAILIILGGFWLIERSTINEKEIYNEVYADTHRFFILPDSSKIWLQPGTSIRYAQNFMSKRKVWLKGDAIFEVVHQSNKPFLVYLNEAFVEVKGTVFRVNTQKTTSDEVTLYSGRIDLHTEKTKEVICMSPNQQAIIDRQNTVALKNISCMKWDNGRYVFKEVQLASLISSINEIYDVKVVVDKNILSHHLFSGNIYYNENPSVIIKKICYTLKLEYQSDGKLITIYKP